MPRTFCRNIEGVVRVLTRLSQDEKQPAAMRARCGELVLASYGIVALAPEQKSRHQGLKQIQDALRLSTIDKTIAVQVRAEQAKQRKERKLQREIEKLLSHPTTQETK